ncbi:enoyl-CoA hydratase/isomerase family protein [Gryllotalpicola protaetiae]|uniref:Enoyl-CoA hydratase/isomerase family protein n=1 Tax=Gryllotalpicola protaetiae TaxID=2419771 RepID=A0A387BMJ7_9MICO|nr:enoyl-CoA hydratase/isomerase family protein [Gryllotalpicola protaetiae]AYG03908.1 enoyl-CoA hydratase/isomerase family protein [Gryllotalpicola protaetiae]
MSFLNSFRPEQFRLTAESDTFWRVTFTNPPVNVIGPAMIRELKELLTELETDPGVNVVVFDSDNPDYYLAHYDLVANPAEAESLPSPTGFAAWPDVLVRLSKIPAVTISAIRGIARGAGSEFVLATDIRFASREKAILGQMEVGFSALPGGGAQARLSPLVGRARSFEILLSGSDFDGDLAERYGYVNRAVPDASFTQFVTDWATRVSKWDPRVIREIKAAVNAVTLPADALFPPQSDAFWAAAAQPRFQAVKDALVAQGLQQISDIELNLGDQIAEVAEKAFAEIQ